MEASPTYSPRGSSQARVGPTSASLQKARSYRSMNFITEPGLNAAAAACTRGGSGGSMAMPASALGGTARTR